MTLRSVRGKHFQQLYSSTFLQTGAEPYVHTNYAKLLKDEIIISNHFSVLTIASTDILPNSPSSNNDYYNAKASTTTTY